MKTTTKSNKEETKRNYKKTISTNKNTLCNCTHCVFKYINTCVACIDIFISLATDWFTDVIKSVRPCLELILNCNFSVRTFLRECRWKWKGHEFENLSFDVDFANVQKVLICYDLLIPNLLKMNRFLELLEWKVEFSGAFFSLRWIFHQKERIVERKVSSMCDEFE